MASGEKSFEDLLKEAPSAPAAETVSLVGALGQSSEAGKFVLTLQDGSAVTLETASVRNYAVLGTPGGQTIVRVDVDVAKVPPSAFGTAGAQFKPPWSDQWSWESKTPRTDMRLWWDPKPVADHKAWSDPTIV